MAVRTGYEIAVGCLNTPECPKYITYYSIAHLADEVQLCIQYGVQPTGYRGTLRVTPRCGTGTIGSCLARTPETDKRLLHYDRMVPGTRSGSTIDKAAALRLPGPEDPDHNMKIHSLAAKVVCCSHCLPMVNRKGEAILVRGCYLTVSHLRSAYKTALNSCNGLLEELLLGFDQPLRLEEVYDNFADLSPGFRFMPNQDPSKIEAIWFSSPQARLAHCSDC
eukprot:Em0376g3a